MSIVRWNDKRDDWERRRRDFISPKGGESVAPLYNSGKEDSRNTENGYSDTQRKLLEELSNIHLKALDKSIDCTED